MAWGIVAAVTAPAEADRRPMPPGLPAPVLDVDREIAPGLPAPLPAARLRPEPVTVPRARGKGQHSRLLQRLDDRNVIQRNRLRPRK